MEHSPPLKCINTNFTEPFHLRVSELDSSISEFGLIHCCKQGFQSKIDSRMANSVDPDEIALYELSHLDLHCLQRRLYWSAGMKGLM